MFYTNSGFIHRSLKHKLNILNSADVSGPLLYVSNCSLSRASRIFLQHTFQSQKNLPNFFSEKFIILKFLRINLFHDFTLSDICSFFNLLLKTISHLSHNYHFLSLLFPIIVLFSVPGFIFSIFLSVDFIQFLNKYQL
uniref:Uncharacterized protein n=1 Tax=Heterorhabditis bacteriophora TaxID=37862 RepID=A0A1I7WQS2_HETBA